MEVKDIIKNRRLELGLTMKQIADRVGVSEGTVSRWESGDIENMKRDKIVALSKALNISPAIIMEWEELSDSKNTSKSIRIPVYGRVAAGIPMEAITDITDYEEIPADWPGEYISLQVKGDSMLPKISDGDVIIARIQPDAESGDFVVAQINGEDATVKKLLKRKDGITLQPLNPNYEPLFFSAEERENIPVKIIGKVVEIRIKL